MSHLKEILFIGGPVHGTRRQVQKSHDRFAFPVFNHPAQFVGPNDPLPFHGYSEAVYEERRFVLTGGCTMKVFVPVDYSEAAAARALADYVEGTPRCHAPY